MNSEIHGMKGYDRVQHDVHQKGMGEGYRVNVLEKYLGANFILSKVQNWI